MKKKVLITSALPYANGALHFGHIAGAYLPADVFARFQRLQGCDVLYLCGSDEYGVAITLSADLAGRTPREQVDHFHAVIQDFFVKMNMSFDHYSRTTWEGHVETVQEFFLDLLHNGHMEEKTTKQLFSLQENRFLADRYVQGICPKCGFGEARGDECPSCGASYEATDLKEPRSKISQAPLVCKDTTHWFLRFDHFKEQLTQWIETKSWKSNVVHFALPYIQDLKPRAITRDSDWGVPIPLPGTEGKVLYVWFDAPIGYISAAKHWSLLQGDKDLWKRYWLDPDTRLVQFIGKDNIPFHAIFFPAMVMGQNTPYKLVDDLPANEFYNLEGRQFSKSDGWVIDLSRFFEEFSADTARYAIASNAPETGDADFSWKDFQSRVNGDLLGKYGNFIHRVLVFLCDKMDGVVPALESIEEADRAFLQEAQALVEAVASAYEGFSCRRASQIIMELASLGNAYFDKQKPWKLYKDHEQRVRLHTVIACCIVVIHQLAVISYPIIPTSAQKIWHYLGYHSDLGALLWKDFMDVVLPVGRILQKPSVLFAKIEDSVIEVKITELQKLVQRKKVSAVPSALITIDDVKKLEIRVGKIQKAERVLKSSKLLVLQVDIGEEVRQIVAGIGEGREEIESLVGQKIAVVVNLQPARIMGVESRGMVLAASSAEGLELSQFFSSSAGAVIR